MIDFQTYPNQIQPPANPPKPMLTKSFLILTFFSFCLGLTTSHGQQKFASLGDFKLENGQVIQDCKIGYRTFGKLNAQKTNAILILTWFGGAAENLKGMANPGSMADSTHFFVIAVDAIGNGVSSSPSNSTRQPNEKFPLFTIRDLVKSQHEVVTKNLKINHLYAVMGVSMGGMQSFQWSVSYPDFMDRVVPMVGTPRQSSYDVLFWNLELRTLERGNYSREAMKTTGLIHELNLLTPEYGQKKRPFSDAITYIEGVERNQDAINPYNWASQIRAMLTQDITQGKSLEETAKGVKAKMMIIVATQDHMVNPASAMEFAKFAKAPLVELTSNCGHLATSCESEKVTAFVRSFYGL